ncbi:hypothetical protein H0H87_003242 [Tephrocybe sp. NHM501043]|nr:hypothetical protein H0H87_003242 [Tephrocybe sp. NHM501043]
MSSKITQSTGPVSKRARRDSDESVKSTVSAKTKNTHIRTASSISLTRAQLQETTGKPAATAKKPSSIVSGRRSPSQSVYPSILMKGLSETYFLCRRAGSPDIDVDDSLSIADSTISTGRVRRIEAQRVEYFKNEPLCGALTKDSAECKRCGKAVRLGNRTTYRIRPWEMHRAKCDQTSVPTNDDVNDDIEKTKQRAKTVEQRIAILSADPAVSSLKPHEVLCRNCGTWVRLSTNVPYKIANWKAHTLSCHALTMQQPSDRVASATRKLRLLNDSQVKSFTDTAIVCDHCDSTITANGDTHKGEHGLIAWEEHKILCTRPQIISPKIRKTAILIATPPSTVPQRPPHSSASVASTDATLIASDTKQTAGTKRLREDEENSDGSSDSLDARPAIRVRIEAPSDESASAASWLALPFQAFIRGFKESLAR